MDTTPGMTWHDRRREPPRNTVTASSARSASQTHRDDYQPQASGSQSPPESAKPTYPPEYEDYVDPPQYSLPPRRMKRKTVNPHILPPPTYSEDPISAAPPSSSTKPEPAIKQKKPPHFKLMEPHESTSRDGTGCFGLFGFPEAPCAAPRATQWWAPILLTLDHNTAKLWHHRRRFPKGYGFLLNFLDDIRMSPAHNLAHARVSHSSNILPNFSGNYEYVLKIYALRIIDSADQIRRYGSGFPGISTEKAQLQRNEAQLILVLPWISYEVTVSAYVTMKDDPSTVCVRSTSGNLQEMSTPRPVDPNQGGRPECESSRAEPTSLGNIGEWGQDKRNEMKIESVRVTVLGTPTLGYLVKCDEESKPHITPTDLKAGAMASLVKSRAATLHPNHKHPMGQLWEWAQTIGPYGMVAPCSALLRRDCDFVKCANLVALLIASVRPKNEYKASSCRRYRNSDICPYPRDTCTFYAYSAPSFPTLIFRMQILTTPSTPTDATINIQTQATLSTPSDISLNIEALAHAGLSAPADASVKHRSTALPACAICTNLLHPTHRPAKRIVCGHTYCRECVQTLCSLGQGCPGKCRGNRRLRPRDVRTLHISIAPTSESEDDEAALSVIMALLAKRTRLEGLEVSETEESDRVSKCIANQLSTLRRFTSISKKAFSAKKQAVSELKAVDEELRVAIDNEGKLLSELSVVQCQLRAVRREVPQLDLDGNAANMNIHAANMNTMTDIRLTLKRTLAETGDEIDGSPCPSKRARTPEAQDVPGPSSPRAIRPRPRPIRPVTIQLSSPHDLPYIFIGIQLNPAPMGFRGNSKKDPSPSVAPAPPSRREEDSPASENASACPSDSGFGERRSGGDGELASSSISGALQHQFQPGILARLVCLLGVSTIDVLPQLESGIAVPPAFE
ncbi:hypothetical protein DFP72DRAFT_1051317 [Ephemerocybe angulata]|uniref:RING-type domain-containing protein n=1 Tax=Ephemerocybe angulata TaxID=980116 RepID=A0A8H6HEI7_9AGAR|nr:hypothetical protein DFP72DRAFT_1051317 [Tulosesus angulatus]